MILHWSLPKLLLYNTFMSCWCMQKEERGQFIHDYWSTQFDWITYKNSYAEISWFQWVTNYSPPTYNLHPLGYIICWKWKLWGLRWPEQQLWRKTRTLSFKAPQVTLRHCNPENPWLRPFTWYILPWYRHSAKWKTSGILSLMPKASLDSLKLGTS